MDDDRPYVLRVGDHRLVELPPHWSLDDWEQYAFLPDPNIGATIELPSKVLELWRCRARRPAAGGRARRRHDAPVPLRPGVTGGGGAGDRRLRARLWRRLDRAARRDRRRHALGAGRRRA